MGIETGCPGKVSTPVNINKNDEKYGKTFPNAYVHLVNFQGAGHSPVLTYLIRKL